MTKYTQMCMVDIIIINSKNTVDIIKVKKLQSFSHVT